MVRSALLRADKNNSSSTYTEAGSTGISEGLEALSSIERPYRPKGSVLKVRTMTGRNTCDERE